MCVTCVSYVCHMCVTCVSYVCHMSSLFTCQLYVTCSVTDQHTAMDDSLDDLDIADAGEVIAVTIHRTDKLKTDFIMSHPVVRVTVVNGDTGMLLKKQHRLVEVS